MILPNTKSRVFLIILVTSFFLVIAGSISFYLLTSKPKIQESSQRSSAQENKKAQKIPKATLAAEQLTQFKDTTNKYNLDDIQGTPNKSLFPDITNPNFLVVSKETNIQDSDIVASFHVGDDYRAYPLKYILFHHIVNDKFGKKPVLISFCGICNSAAAYNSTLDGETLSFGVLGVLYLNNLVMYDRNSDSWWTQITGEAISGKYKGKKLTLLPGMELIKFSEFKKTHPKGKVLQPIAQYASSYELYNPNQFYETEPESQSRDQVVGIEIREKSRAYKITDVREKKIINESLNGWSLLIVSGPNDGGVRIFRRFIEENERILDFELKDGNLVDKQTNSTWNFNGEATKGELKGTTLDKPKYLELYLFAWKDFYPKTLLYKP